MMTDSALLIEYPDGTRGHLNGALVARQGLSQDDVAALRESHLAKARVVTMMTAETSPDNLLHYARMLDAIESFQQSLWRFPLDPLFHYWWEIPHCTCSSFLARRLYGTSPFRVVDRACPVHGQLLSGYGKPLLGKGGTELMDTRVIVETTGCPVSIEVPSGHQLVDTREPLYGSALLRFQRPD